MVKVCPSLLAADFGCLASEIAEVEAAGADCLHVDVMDGHYVPNITIGPVVVKGIASAAKVPFDVHLMITDPLHYARVMAPFGVRGFFFHASTVDDPAGAIDMIRSFGIKAGLAFNPDEDVREAAHLIERVDYVLVMTVFPGFGGQEFIETALDNVRAACELFDGDIAVDGGVSPETAPRVAAAGGNILIAGSSVFGRPDRAEAVRRLREAAQTGR